MASQEGDGVRFSDKNWEGGIIFTSKFFGGFSFETLNFFENHRRRPPPLPPGRNQRSVP